MGRFRHLQLFVEFYGHRVTIAWIDQESDLYVNRIPLCIQNRVAGRDFKFRKFFGKFFIQIPTGKCITESVGFGYVKFIPISAFDGSDRGTAECFKRDSVFSEFPEGIEREILGRHQSPEIKGSFMFWFVIPTLENIALADRFFRSLNRSFIAHFRRLNLRTAHGIPGDGVFCGNPFGIERHVFFDWFLEIIFLIQIHVRIPAAEFITLFGRFFRLFQGSSDRNQDILHRSPAVAFKSDQGTPGDAAGKEQGK